VGEAVGVGLGVGVGSAPRRPRRAVGQTGRHASPPGGGRQVTWRLGGRGCRLKRVGVGGFHRHASGRHTPCAYLAHALRLPGTRPAPTWHTPCAYLAHALRLPGTRPATRHLPGGSPRPHDNCPASLLATWQRVPLMAAPLPGRHARLPRRQARRTAETGRTWVGLWVGLG
jgi:hypothetical protein